MLPLLLDVAGIHHRLQAIFPDGAPQRGYVTREMSARTIFVMLHIGAVAGNGIWMAPKHVYRMGERQSRRRSEAERTAFASAVEKPGFAAPRDRWFQDNTREPIRDETLRDGLVGVGAVVKRRGLATTSSKGRYALQSGFASLFDPALKDEALSAAIASWQNGNLSPGALARIRLQEHSGAAAKTSILVSLPSGETRAMAAGVSSVITKAVIEVFAPRFLGDPAVLWISESGNKIVQRDDALARDIGLKIETDKLLPDMILVDLKPHQPLIVFVEAVATDGPVSETRRSALPELVEKAGFTASQVAFVSAFQDRSSAAFKKAIHNLAWGSFAWCMSEPEHVIALDGMVPGGVALLSGFG